MKNKLRIWIRIQDFDDKKYIPENIAIYLSLGLHKIRPSYRRSLQPSKEKIQHAALQKMKFINCFLFFWAIYALLNPDPDPNCESGSGYGSRGPTEQIRIHNTREDTDQGIEKEIRVKKRKSGRKKDRGR